MSSLQEQRWSRIFDSWAERPELASTGSPVGDGELQALGAQLADWLGLDGSQSLLDVGCASGRLTRQLARRAGQTLGVDASTALIEAAAACSGGPELQFQQGDARRLPFADGSFDTVCSFAMLLCLPDHQAVEQSIDELLRVARPDCSILLGSLPDPRHKEAFFAHCEALAPWYRRALPRGLRRRLRALLHPGHDPEQTDILWFDINALADRMRARGFVVDVLRDPVYENYQDYRCSLLLRRGRPMLRELDG